MKYVSLIVACFLILGSFSSIGFANKSAIRVSYNQDFGQLQQTLKTVNQNTFTLLEFDEAQQKIHIPGNPMLPMYTKLITIPFGSTIKEIQVETNSVAKMSLSHKILPAPYPVTDSTPEKNNMYRVDSSLYSSDSYFPTEWIKYFNGAGIDKQGNRINYLTIQYYPVQYNPVKNNIRYVDEIDVSIILDSQENPVSYESDLYDLVMIAPDDFTDELQPLVEHKNNHEMKTLLKTTTDIYKEYPGVDKPEQIKYFIKDAIEQWNISYILLVGGLKSMIYATPRDDKNQGSSDWYVPVRYTNLQENNGDPGFISDLYYADIYDSEGNFSSWDSNNDGIFAKWKSLFKKDNIDLFPDISVGRLPCRNGFEVTIMVDKIIEYESSQADSSWFDNLVLIAGDTHDDEGTDYIEGELMCDYILEQYMVDFNPVKLYASNRYDDPEYVCSPENIMREISNGCGYLFFTGHASPASWNTHWPDEPSWADTPGGITIFDFHKLENDEKLPICIVEGCHSSQFNISFFATLLGKPYMWISGVGIPECWSWWLTRKIGGGSIATFGHTGLSYERTGEYGDLDEDGVNLPDCLEVYCGYQNLQFFKTCAEGHERVGDLWSGTITKYLQMYPGMNNQIDAKTMEQWVLMGDPSLKIGGYP